MQNQTGKFVHLVRDGVCRKVKVTKQHSEGVIVADGMMCYGRGNANGQWHHQKHCPSRVARATVTEAQRRRDDDIETTMIRGCLKRLRSEHKSMVQDKVALVAEIANLRLYASSARAELVVLLQAIRERNATEVAAAYIGCRPQALGVPPCPAGSFGAALEDLKAGKRVARTGWNGKGMWLSLSPGNPKLPAERFWSPHNAEFAFLRPDRTADVLPCITMKTADGKILMGWLASQTDMLADDWVIVDT